MGLSQQDNKDTERATALSCLSKKIEALRGLKCGIVIVRQQKH